MEQYKPLKGVKVVELSLMVASASCGRMMADWGADVIKLENTKGGDNFRKWPLSIGAPADDDFDPIFDNLNANKRAVSIDTRTKEGQEIVYRLLEDADVFLTNLRTEALGKQGLDYDTLKEKFPKLVMCQLDGYGPKGEEAGRPGYDNTAFWARGGFMYSQAVYGDSNDTYPVYMPMGFGDTTCALGMMAATVSAVLSARQTGKGDRVSLSLYGTAAWLAVVFNRDTPIFYHLLGADDMIGDPRYATRAQFNDVNICRPVIERFEKIFATKTAKEWYDMFSAEGLCCEILARYEDVLTDPQAIANDFVYKMKYDNGQEATLVRTCLRSERMGTPEFNRGPMLGEHTVSILKEAGYSDEEIEKYLSEGIIRQHD